MTDAEKIQKYGESIGVVNMTAADLIIAHQTLSRMKMPPPEVRESQIDGLRAQQAAKLKAYGEQIGMAGMTVADLIVAHMSLRSLLRDRHDDRAALRQQIRNEVERELKADSYTLAQLREITLQELAERLWPQPSQDDEPYGGCTDD